MTIPECNSQDCANGRARNEQKHNSHTTAISRKDSSDISSESSASSSSSSSAVVAAAAKNSITCLTTTAVVDSSATRDQNRQQEGYWKAQYDSLLEDHRRLQRLNDKLEDRLLNIVEECERNKQECVAKTEYEKSTLMADVNKLSTKLVDARIRLHDYEEKELLHAAECSSPCHRGLPSTGIDGKNNLAINNRDQAYDPNLV